MEEEWAMARWISNYIDENSDRWKREKSSRKDDDKMGLSCAKLREGGASKLRLSSIYLEVEVVFHLP